MIEIIKKKKKKYCASIIRLIINKDLKHCRWRFDIGDLNE